MKISAGYKIHCPSKNVYSVDTGCQAPFWAKTPNHKGWPMATLSIIVLWSLTGQASSNKGNMTALL